MTLGDRERYKEYEFEKEIRTLKAQIKKMKCCGNCNHNKPDDKEYCWNCERKCASPGEEIIKDEWEICE